MKQLKIIYIYLKGIIKMYRYSEREKLVFQSILTLKLFNVKI